MLKHIKNTWSIRLILSLSILCQPLAVYSSDENVLVQIDGVDVNKHQGKAPSIHLIRMRIMASQLEKAIPAQDTKATETEIARFVERYKAQYKELATQAAMMPEDDFIRALAKSEIQQWKLHSLLYEQYGGRVAKGPSGIVPFDAYAALLQKGAEAREFIFYDKILEDEFWDLYRNERRYVFLDEPGYYKRTPHWQD